MSTFFQRVIISVAFCLAVGPGAAWAQQDGPALSTIVDAWLASPHGDAEAEAFRHWDEDGEIPGSCAVCHSGIGFEAFAAAPGDAVSSIDHPVPLGRTVDCATCHSSAAMSLAEARFPSGEVIGDFGESAVCATCHQGRASTVQVMAATEALDPDTVSAELGFINVHYKAAAATQMGTRAKGGFEYPGKTYAGAFGHVPDFNTCTSCHAPHSLEIDFAQCTTCHEGAEGPRDIRLRPVDYDGDSDVAEGVAEEIETIRTRLGDAIVTYAAEVSGAPVVYDAGAYPYFFNDTDADGSASAEEAAYPNRYSSWTPRMLRAAYNYQYASKDGGGYAHNPHYVLQLLHDSLEDLGSAADIDAGGLTRP